MNKLYAGFNKQVELPKNGFLLIADEVPELPEWRTPRVFDPLKDSFNPLKGIEYKKARELAEVLYWKPEDGGNGGRPAGVACLAACALLEAEFHFQRKLSKPRPHYSNGPAKGVRD